MILVCNQLCISSVFLSKCLLAFCVTASSVTAFYKSAASSFLLRCDGRLSTCNVSATRSASCGRGTSHSDLCTTGYSTHSLRAKSGSSDSTTAGRLWSHHSGETAYSSADDAHRNNAEQLVAPIWELLLLSSFVGTSCSVGRIRSILKHTR